MRINNIMNVVMVPLVATMLLSGCAKDDSSSGDGSTGGGGTSSTLTGTYIDAPTQGLAYKTITQSGLTDDKGQFKYVAGEEIEFKLGNLVLGKGKASALVTPYTITDNNETANNIALLIQNFDGDRTNTGVLDLSNLKDVNLSDVNLSINNTDMQQLIGNLFSDPRFSAKYSGATLLTASEVKTKMDNYIRDNSTKYDKKFTQTYLDTNVFYKSSDEYPHYKNQYRNGGIYFAGDSANGSWDDPFGSASSTYTIADGIIHATFSNGDKVTVEILNVYDAYIEVSETHAVHGTRTSIWYTDKSAALFKTSGFTKAYLQDRVLYQKYVGEPKLLTYDFSSEKSFTDSNVGSATNGQTLTGFNAGDGVSVIKDGEIYEFTYNTVNNQPLYNDGINVFSITDVNNIKITTKMDSYTVYWYFNESDAQAGK